MCDDILVVNFKDFGSQAALASAFGDRWIYIGRENRGAGFDASLLANPFRVAEYGGRGKTLPFYRRWLWDAIRGEDEKILEALGGISEITVLVCWCKPGPCHGDVVRKAAAWLRKQL